MSQVVILIATVALLLTSAGRALAVSSNADCEAKLAIRIGQVLSGARHLQKFSSINNLPRIFRTRWQEANVLEFPFSFLDAFNLGISWKNVRVLHSLSRKIETLRQVEAPLGWIQDGSIFVEVASDIQKAKGVTRTLLVTVNDRRYRIRVELAAQADVGHVGGYRDPARRADSVWMAIIPWHDLSEMERNKLRSHDALGVTVETTKKHLFTRVEHEKLDQIGVGVSFRDEETGLVWSSPTKEKMSQAEAKAYCRGHGAELPTMTMLKKLSEKQGQHLILDQSYLWFWSSTVDHSWAAVLHGNGDVSHNRINIPGLVVCVGR